MRNITTNMSTSLHRIIIGTPMKALIALMFMVGFAPAWAVNTAILNLIVIASLKI